MNVMSDRTIKRWRMEALTLDIRLIAIKNDLTEHNQESLIKLCEEQRQRIIKLTQELSDIKLNIMGRFQ
jgi:hypothetical protein